MSRVLVDREEIESVRNTLANGGGAVGVLRWAETVLAAQPAEAEGVDRWSELKKLAEKAAESGFSAPEPWDQDRRYSDAEVAWLEFAGKATPAVVLELLAALSAERARADVAVADANDAERALVAVTAERDRLQAALSAPDTITAEPAGDYDNLRKQFQSLRRLANSNAKMVHHWRAQCSRETRETLLANAASVNAERDTNSMLTDALETAERERDRLRAEVEALRKDAERYRFLMRELGGSVSQVVMGSPVFSNEDVDAAIDAAMAAKEE